MSMISSSSATGDLSYLQQLLYSNSNTTTTTSTTTTETSALLSASDMFSKLTEEVGGDGKSISKTELENYINTVKSDTTGKYDKGELGFLTQLDSNWDSISGGSDSITESQMSSEMSYLQPPSSNSSGSTDSLASDLYSELYDILNSSSDGISLDDLTKYLKQLTSEVSSDSTTTSNSTSTSSNTTTSTTESTKDSELAKEIDVVSDLITNYDDYSSDTGYITSNSLLSAMKQPQDTSTITSEQLTSPIDIRV